MAANIKSPFDIADSAFNQTLQAFSFMHEVSQDAMENRTEAYKYRASVEKDTMESAKDMYQAEQDQFWKQKEYELNLVAMSNDRIRLQNESERTQRIREDQQRNETIRSEVAEISRKKAALSAREKEVLARKQATQLKLEQARKNESQNNLPLGMMKGLGGEDDESPNSSSALERELDEINKEHTEILNTAFDYNSIDGLLNNGIPAQSSFPQHFQTKEYVPEQSSPDESGRVSLFPKNSAMQSILNDIELLRNDLRDGKVNSEEFDRRMAPLQTAVNKFPNSERSELDLKTQRESQYFAPTQDSSPEPEPEPPSPDSEEKLYQEKVKPNLSSVISQFKKSQGSLLVEKPEAFQDISSQLGKFNSMFVSKYPGKEEDVRAAIKAEAEKSYTRSVESINRLASTLAGSGLDTERMMSSISSSSTIKQLKAEYRVLGGDELDVDIALNNAVSTVSTFVAENENQKDPEKILPVGSLEFRRQLNARLSAGREQYTVPQSVRTGSTQPASVKIPPPSKNQTLPISETFREEKDITLKQSKRAEETRSRLKNLGINEDDDIYIKTFDTSLRGEAFDQLLEKAKKKKSSQPSKVSLSEQELVEIGSVQEFGKISPAKRFHIARNIMVYAKERLEKDREEFSTYSEYPKDKSTDPYYTKLTQLEEDFKAIEQDNDMVNLYKFVNKWKAYTSSKN